MAPVTRDQAPGSSSRTADVFEEPSLDVMVAFGKLKSLDDKRACKIYEEFQSRKISVAQFNNRMIALVESSNSADKNASRRGKKGRADSSSAELEQKQQHKSLSAAPKTAPVPGKKKGEEQKTGKMAEKKAESPAASNLSSGGERVNNKNKNKLREKSSSGKDSSKKERAPSQIREGDKSGPDPCQKRGPAVGAVRGKVGATTIIKSVDEDMQLDSAAKEKLSLDIEKAPFFADDSLSVFRPLPLGDGLGIPTMHLETIISKKMAEEAASASAQKRNQREQQQQQQQQQQQLKMEEEKEKEKMVEEKMEEEKEKEEEEHVHGHRDGGSSSASMGVMNLDLSMSLASGLMTPSPPLPPAPAEGVPGAQQALQQLQQPQPPLQPPSISSYPQPDPTWAGAAPAFAPHAGQLGPLVCDLESMMHLPLPPVVDPQGHGSPGNMPHFGVGVDPGVGMNVPPQHGHGMIPSQMPSHDLGQYSLPPMPLSGVDLSVPPLHGMPSPAHLSNAYTSPVPVHASMQHPYPYSHPNSSVGVSAYDLHIMHLQNMHAQAQQHHQMQQLREQHAYMDRATPDFDPAPTLASAPAPAPVPVPLPALAAVVPDTYVPQLQPEPAQTHVEPTLDCGDESTRELPDVGEAGETEARKEVPTGADWLEPEAEGQAGSVVAPEEEEDAADSGEITFGSFGDLALGERKGEINRKERKPKFREKVKEKDSPVTAAAESEPVVKGKGALKKKEKSTRKPKGKGKDDSASKTPAAVKGQTGKNEGGRALLSFLRAGPSSVVNPFEKQRGGA